MNYSQVVIEECNTRNNHCELILACKTDQTQGKEIFNKLSQFRVTHEKKHIHTRTHTQTRESYIQTLQ